MFEAECGIRYSILSRVASTRRVHPPLQRLHLLRRHPQPQLAAPPDHIGRVPCVFVGHLPAHLGFGEGGAEGVAEGLGGGGGSEDFGASVPLARIRRAALVGAFGVSVAPITPCGRSSTAGGRRSGFAYGR